MLFVPRGFAHGFLTLEDDTEFLYKCDDIYDAGYESGIKWDDNELNIDWDKYMRNYDIFEPLLLPKDESNLLFHEYRKHPIF